MLQDKKNVNLYAVESELTPGLDSDILSLVDNTSPKQNSLHSKNNKKYENKNILRFGIG